MSCSPSAFDPAARRAEIGADSAATVLAATALRLAEAIAEYDAALDRRATLLELQYLDRAVARAEREHAASRRAGRRR